MKPKINNIKLIHNSLQGVKRDQNQDDILVLSNSVFHLSILFDGISSLKDSIGYIQLCKQFIQENYHQYVCGDKIKLKELVYHIHVKSLEFGEDGKTTCSALLLKEGFRNAYIVNVGDSRIYSFSNSYLEVLTQDDNMPGNSNILTKYIGLEGLKPLEINQFEVDSNQNFLICSDGFYSLMEKDVKSYFRIFQYKRNGNIINAINRLQKNKNSDDSTYIIIRNERI